MTTIQFVEYSDQQDVIHDIRLRVFTEEQGVDPDLDFDGQDADAFQVIAFANEIPVGTGRMLRDGHIGRIAVLREHRKTGAGTAIVTALIDKAATDGFSRVFLGAQVTAVPFYEKLGFRPDGENYMEANILHTPMALVFDHG